MTKHLKKSTLQPLPLGSIKPKGWLNKQLITQKEGLTGNLHTFWNDIKNSQWIGGNAEGWERAPYWLDGYVPLAYLLDDESMKTEVSRWINAIIDFQRPDGWIGPVGDLKYGYAYDPWPNFIVCKVMIQYFEATEDKRVIQTLSSFMKFLYKYFDQKILRSWGRYRWADLVFSIQWLFDFTGESWLLDLAETVHQQGFKWMDYFKDMPIREKIIPPEQSLSNHVVNCAMGVKSPAIWYRHVDDDKNREGTDFIIESLEKYHGQATAMFSGDEHLAGKNPSQGYELCAVVEYMYSLEIAGSILGFCHLFDRLESLAYNALPATISPDMCSHQYNQQVNQVQCTITPDNPWTTNNDDANIFGLEPNFGCCTANMHQGWPKFASSLWMKTLDGGLAAVAYAPCVVKTLINSSKVKAEVVTSYPFDEKITIRLNTEKPLHFPLKLRIPAWATDASVKVDGKSTSGVKAGGFLTIDQQWQADHVIEIVFPMKLRFEERFNQSRSYFLGPLLLALKIEEEWKQIKGEKPFADYEIRALSPWNYALLHDQKNGLSSYQIKRSELNDKDLIFHPQKVPLIVETQARLVENWTIKNSMATPPAKEEAIVSKEIHKIELIPYGATNLRIGEFPIVNNEEC